MGFITPCFIRKNTPELQEKLKNIGYLSLDNDNDKRDGLVADRNVFMYSFWRKMFLIVRTTAELMRNFSWLLLH